MLINSGTQLMITGNNGMVYLIALPALNTEVEFPLQGTVTAAFCSDALPNNLFFGLAENFTLKLVT